MTRLRQTLLLLTFWWLAAAPPASAQIVESVGVRALGMGGAFVAVADDSTATWWNPAALAAGPFVDLSLGWQGTETGGEGVRWRERGWWVSFATPPLGLSYYRLKTTDIGLIHPIAQDGGGREDRRAVVPAWSLSASQVGATLVHSVASGIHVGTTLKFVRVNGLGAELTETEPVGIAQVSGDLDRLIPDRRSNFDLDIGLLAVLGAVRVGGVMRNVRETDLPSVSLPRQARLGVAVTRGERHPVTLSLDADARSYPTALGDRRVVAVGGESWTWDRRLGVRAGARVNTVGSEERAVTAGASFAVRTGVYVEAFVVRGGTDDERGWGVAARASF